MRLIADGTVDREGVYLPDGFFGHGAVGVWEVRIDCAGDPVGRKTSRHDGGGYPHTWDRR